MPGQSQLYSTVDSIAEGNDSSSMHTGLGTRYDWKSILPDDIHSEVEELFKDNKSPADFMKHTGFTGITQGSQTYSTGIYDSTPRDMEYGELLSQSNEWDWNNHLGNPNYWSNYSGMGGDNSDIGPTFWNAATDNENDDNLLKRLSDLGPNAFPEGSSLDDIQSWMGSFVSDTTNQSTFPGYAGGGNWGNAIINEGSYPEAYYNGRRANPYFAQFMGTSGNVNRKAHREIGGVVDDARADTFQGGQTTSQNLLGMTDLFNPNSIGDALTEVGDLGETSYGYAPPLSMDMIREARSQHYRPLLEASRGSAYSNYNQAQSEARSLGSGFAGYGGRARAMDRATDAYSKQIGGTMSEMSKLRGDARGKIGNVINEWRQISNT